MKLEYYKVEKQNRKKKTPTVCQYNDACQCITKDCDRCGWNPKVAQKRTQEFLQKQKRDGL
jgi:hypothetical protein